MAEEPPDIQNAVLRVSKLLDKVIEEHHLLADARTEEEQFRNTFLPPAPLQGVPFQGAEGLVKFSEETQRFEEQRAQVSGRLQDAERRYSEAAEQVASILPVGTSVAHEYGGEDPQLKGQYEIRNGGGDIKVIGGR